MIHSFSGHTDNINELAVRSPNDFLSASEDGTVQMWDVRSNSVHVFDVSSESSVDRDRGFGVCALDVDEDFMVILGFK